MPLTNYSTGVYRLNWPVVALYDALKAESDDDFYAKLENSYGLALWGKPILASEQDVLDYIRLTEFDENDPLGWRKSDHDNAVRFILEKMVYDTYSFMDNKTNKFGLRDSCGKVIVPPLFDECETMSNIIFCKTLPIVSRDGALWFAKRDGSGEVANEHGYDDIRHSFCFAWVSRDGKKGFCNAFTGEEIVRCEMDWMIGSQCFELFGKDGKIGMTDKFVPEDCCVIKPVISAINLTTRELLVDGQWGRMRNDGSFISDESEICDNCVDFNWCFEECLKNDQRYSNLGLLDEDEPQGQIVQLGQEETDELFASLEGVTFDDTFQSELEESAEEVEMLAEPQRLAELSAWDESGLIQAANIIKACALSMDSDNVKIPNRSAKLRSE